LGMDGARRRRPAPPRSDAAARRGRAGHRLGPGTRSHGDGRAGNSRHPRSVLGRSGNDPLQARAVLTMPTISINRRDLERLIGRTATDKDLDTWLPLVKGEVKDY